MKNLLLLVMLLLATNSVAFSQTRREKREEKKAERVLETLEAMSQMITTDTSFCFTLKSVGTSYGPSGGSANGFYFKIDKGVIDCYLPFFGRTYTATLSGGGVEFNSDKFTYIVDEKNDNSGWIIDIDATVENSGKYGITMHASPSGNSTLIINPPGKSAMTYSGVLEKN